MKKLLRSRPFPIFILLLLPLWLLALAATAQAPPPVLARLRAALQNHPQPDTGRVNRLNALGLAQYSTAPQQAIAAYREALPLARRLGYVPGEAVTLLSMGFYYRFRNEYAPALAHTQRARQLFRQLGDSLNQIKCFYNLAYAESGQGHYGEAMAYSLEGLRLAEAIRNSQWLTLVCSQLGNTCREIGEYDQARTHLLRGLRAAEAAGESASVARCLMFLGDLHREQRQWAPARDYYQRSMSVHSRDVVGIDKTSALLLMEIAKMEAQMGNDRAAIATGYQALWQLRQTNNVGFIPAAQLVLARAHLHAGRLDSAAFYGRLVLQTGEQSGVQVWIRDGSDVLARLSARRGQFADAYRYQVQFMTYKDSLSSQDVTRRTAALQYTYELEKKQSQIQLLTRNEQLSRQKNRQQQLLLLGALLGLTLVGGLSGLLWRTNRSQQQTNTRLDASLTELRTTQAQLIQKEKMASLGELTAGIAHEIQNPLNFVNNFSDVSAELMLELEEAQAAGDGEEVTALATDVRQNLTKISQHGQRAAGIVRGMLEHSRASTGERALLDINALADEYLRLAYHGLRAKDKRFNAELKTDFAPGLPVVEGVGADLGRVLLNLFNNAFYAVQQRQLAGEAGYMPTLSVQTEQVGKQVHIRVSDNGTGMSPEVQQKIFQPFFTTKPTGEGTGLGLSLAHDIITKGHGGTLTVESQAGQGTAFIITLPNYRR